MRGNRAVRAPRRMISTGALVLVFSLLNISAAMAAVGYEVDIEANDTIVAPAGTVHEVADTDVPAQFHGQQCTVRALGTNQASVHPGTDIIVESGGTSVVAPDAEATPGQVTEGIGTLTLGDEIVVFVRIGPDGIVSVDHIIEIRCLGDPVTGRIIVVKQVADGSDTSQAFQFAADYDADGFALADGQQNDSGDLDPGTYSVSETVPDGWSLQSAMCDDQSAPDAIDLSAGETVTCTFTNAQDAPPPPPDLGRIIVVKQVVAESDTTQAFQFNASYDADGFSLGHGEQNVSANLDPGLYEVDEVPLDGWDFVGASCDDDQSTIDSIEVSAGETVTCTFRNVQTDVGASVLVTVASVCDVVGNQGVGEITVTMSVAGGADVVVRDSGGDVVGALSADGTIEVPDDAVYTWVATPNSGFEFPAGFDNTGSVSIENCSPLEVLPFTGIEEDGLATLALLLLASGALTLLVSRTSKAGTV